MISFFEYYFFLIIVISIISELIISTRWSKFYFTKLPKIPLKIISLNERQLEKLLTLDEYEFKKDMQPTILINKLSKDQIAMREKLFDFSAISYSSIIHGYMQIDKKCKEVKVYGVFNYTMILFVVFLVSQFWNHADLLDFNCSKKNLSRSC